MKVFNILGHDGNNVGDYASSPVNYFDFPFEIEKVNLRPFLKKSAHELDIFRDANIILGGGGLLIFNGLLEHLARIKGKGLIVTWGIGHNTHHANQIDQFPYYLDAFDLNGIRDYGSKYRWVPCASCMSKSFNNPPEPVHDIVIYEHKDFKIKVDGFPRSNNAGGDFDSKVSFLASGDIIITNTYHGAFWGMLLGRKVLVVEPFSSKFYGLHPGLHITDASSWAEQIRSLKSFPDFLQYCQEANRVYYQIVSDLFVNPDACRKLFPVKPSLLERLHRSAYRIKKNLLARF